MARKKDKNSLRYKSEQLGLRYTTVWWRIKHGWTEEEALELVPHKDRRGKSNITHGMSGTKEWVAYRNAKDRCNNPNNDQYERYGGRGIKFKIKSFEEWFDELGLAPSPEHSIDRIDNDGHYEVGNLQWVTQSMQANNRRNNKLLTFANRTQTQAQWIKELGWSRRRFEYYINNDKLDKIQQIIKENSKK